MALSILHCQESLSSNDLLHFLHIIIVIASLSTACNRLPLGLPSGLLFSMFPCSALLGPLLSSSHDPPNGVFSIWYSWLAVFPCMSYKFHDETNIYVGNFFMFSKPLKVKEFFVVCSSQFIGSSSSRWSTIVFVKYEMEYFIMLTFWKMAENSSYLVKFLRCYYQF